MTYFYELTKEDLVNMGIEHTDAERYTVEQSGWSGRFFNMYEVHVCPLFKEDFKGEVVIRGSEIDEDIEISDYIIKNCKCTEYI